MPCYKYGTNHPVVQRKERPGAQRVRRRLAHRPGDFYWISFASFEFASNLTSRQDMTAQYYMFVQSHSTQTTAHRMSRVSTPQLPRDRLSRLEIVDQCPATPLLQVLGHLQSSRDLFSPVLELGRGRQADHVCAAGDGAVGGSERAEAEQEQTRRGFFWGGGGGRVCKECACHAA